MFFDVGYELFSMDTKDMLTEEKYDVRLRHDGQVKINIPQHVTCICRLNIEQFPFDTQFCAVALASPLLTIEEMNVVSHSPPRDSYFAVRTKENSSGYNSRNEYLCPLSATEKRP